MVPQSYTLDRERLADFTLRLIAARSLSSQEGDAARLVAEEMERLGYDVEVDRFGNVIGSLDLGDGPCVLIDSHTDTVGVTDPGAWSHSPSGERVGERIYGRGAMDMKGPLAASIHGIATLREKLRSGRVVVCASVAEEMIEGAMLVEVARRVQPDFVIICEATSLALAQGQRGRAEVLVETFGRPTHSSRPELGINAAQAMVDVIVALRQVHGGQHPVLGQGILVLTDVLSQPYPALSVVPDACTATYDRRTLPGESEEDVLRPIREAMDHTLRNTGATGRASTGIDDFETYTGARVQAANVAAAWFYPEESEIVQAGLRGLTDAGIEPRLTHYAFCTNGSGTAGQLSIPTIGFGPGDETMAHRVDEFIDIDDLVAAAKAYAAIVTRLTSNEA